jgi:deoxycytidylate deaminase
MIINAGVKHITYDDGYPDTLAAEMLSESGIRIEQYIKK